MNPDIGSVASTAAAAQGAPARPEASAQARALQAHYDKVLAESRLKFRVEGEPPRVVVQVVDAHSGEVVRQIPNEDALRLADEFSRRVAGNGSVTA